MFDVNAVVSWASSLDDVYKDPGFRRDRTAPRDLAPCNAAMLEAPLRLQLMWRYPKHTESPRPRSLSRQDASSMAKFVQEQRSEAACLPVCLLKKLRRGVEVWLGTEEVIRCQDNTQAPGPRPRPQKARTLRILLPASSEIPLTTWALHSGTFLCSVGRGLLHCTPFDHHRMFIESLFPATWLQLALCVCSLSDLISWQSARPSDPASVQNKAPSSSNLTEPHADHRSPIGGRLMGTHTSAS